MFSFCTLPLFTPYPFNFFSSHTPFHTTYLTLFLSAPPFFSLRTPNPSHILYFSHPSVSFFSQPLFFNTSFILHLSFSHLFSWQQLSYSFSSLSLFSPTLSNTQPHSLHCHQPLHQRRPLQTVVHSSTTTAPPPPRAHHQAPSRLLTRWTWTLSRSH